MELESISLPLAILAGAVTICAAAEFCLRLWLKHPSGYYVWSPGRRLVFCHDQTVIPGADAQATIRINSLGERGEPPPKSWQGVYRGLVMGASAAECIALDQHNSWPEVIRRELMKDAHLKVLGANKIHIGNIGKSMLHTSAQIAILDAIRSRYEGLDLIVFMVGASDLVAWLEAGAPAERGAKAPAPRNIFDRSPANIGWHWRKLAIYRTLAILKDRLIPSDQILDTYSHRIAARRLRRKTAPILQSDQFDDRSMLAQLESDLGKLLQRAQTIAKRVILVRQPWLDRDLSATEDDMMWLGSVGSSVDSPEPGRYLASRSLCALMARVDAVCKRVAHDQGVEELEVRHIIPQDLEHYIDHIHFGVKGAQIVGSAIAAQILKPASAVSRRV